ncbi:MAG: hypothetical protein M3Z24_05500, partial [Chloroflexota bacterium]|nr:hypothetical protein [Chloroflexota bacterium]
TFQYTQNTQSPHPNTKLNVIQQENALQGTSSWKIPYGQQATTQIQAYASATSVQPGQSISFQVSTQVEGTLYSLGIYRFGWYGGLGGRLKLLVSHLVGHAQGYYDRDAHQLNQCTACHVDTTSGLVEANWQPSYTLTIPPDWVTGVYLAKFADAKGMQTYAPFDVRGNTYATYVLVTSDTTYAAYNQWGGASLYEEGNASSTQNGHIQEGTSSHGVRVSFDRPYVDGYGSGHILLFETTGIHWLERQGYDLSYISSVDLHENARQLLQHRVYLSLGHDEYWTKEMRDGVEYARDHGVGLGFLGANESYWQMRFEPNSKGIADRTLVCYKVETGHNDLAHDPSYGKDNTRITTQWRDPILHRPENSLAGIMYSSLTLTQRGFTWQVNASADEPLLKGTGLQSGQQYGCGIVGYEWDHIFNNGETPKNLHVIAQSNTIDAYHRTDTSNTAYYIAPSGAMVFAAGSIYWTAALDSFRIYPAPLCAVTVVPQIQTLLTNVMVALATKHVG